MFNYCDFWHSKWNKIRFLSINIIFFIYTQINWIVGILIFEIFLTNLFFMLIWTIANLIKCIEFALNLHKKRVLDKSPGSIIKAIVCGLKIAWELGRNSDMVKSSGGKDLVYRCVFKWVRNKLNEKTHPREWVP